jgi:succinate-semialdehyde dehydrogenase/glutarate-semialdehyde dehydrogenase
VVSINSFTTPGAEAPFGGIWDSGIGREGGEESLDAYLVSKTVMRRPTLA